MFDRIILLCAGSVVFQGPPPSVGAYIAKHPSLIGTGKTEDQLERALENPADTVIDGLGSHVMQQFAIGTNITGGRNCEISYRDALLVLRARGDEVWSFNTYAYIYLWSPVSHFCDLL